MIDTLRAFLLVGAVFTGGLLAGAGTVRSAFGQAQDGYAGLETYALALNKVEQVYVEALEPLPLVHASIRGMVDTLDPHSVWLSPDEYKALQERADGRYLGIGVELGAMGDAEMVIDNITPRGPADLAGVQPGDILTAIDDQPLQSLRVEDVQALLSGDIGEPVELRLRRDGQEVTIIVVRDEIVDVSIRGERINGDDLNRDDLNGDAPGSEGNIDIGYVRIEHFHRRAAAETVYAIQELADQGPLGGLIIDLRNNPGGLITEAVEMVDFFVSSGTIVEVHRRDEAPEVYTATHGDELDLPLVVLINGGSASASELVAGSLQDHDRAVLVGVPSYGKGSMQHVYRFSDGSALKLTVARYYLPSGNTIHPNEGLTPDHVVPLLTNETSPVAALHAEIAALPIPDAQRDRLLEQLNALPVRTSAQLATVPHTGSIIERVHQDQQLATAVAILQGRE